LEIKEIPDVQQLGLQCNAEFKSMLDVIGQGFVHLVLKYNIHAWTNCTHIGAGG
jgi:hypothetical protein